MAERPVFVAKKSYPFYESVEVTFKYFAGFALVQRQRNIAGIHEAFHKLYPKLYVLEASSKAPSELGKSLSPFYLMCSYRGKEYPVENVFQAAKVFQAGGPYLQLLDLEAIKAKTTSLTKTSGPLLYYDYDGRKYPLEPKGWLYDWIYMHALHAQPELAKAALDYDAFTDIAFNPKTGSTCQAKALAIYKGLVQKNLLEEALASIPAFLKIVFHAKWPDVQAAAADAKDSEKTDGLAAAESEIQ